MATASKPDSRPTAHTTSRATPRAAARLDASLLLARKGEATPAIAATQHNNPALAWGAAPHPEDFKPRVSASPVSSSPVSASPASVSQAQPVARAQPIATARLRTDSFFAKRRSAQGRAGRTETDPQDDVTLTLRLEEEAYLRLKYLSQSSGCSTQKVLKEALDLHLVRKGVSRTRKIIIQSK